MKLMKLGVVGGRDYEDWPVLKAVLDRFGEENVIEQIVSGGANGADGYAYVYAKKTGIIFVCFPPLKEDLLKYGFAESARRRNRRLAEYCDELIAFPTEKSKGTWHTIGLMRTLEKPYHIIDFKDQ